MLQINIPKPCHEDWNAMTPTSRGAFCSACAKDVVDFTSMTDDEVQHYLLNKAGEKVCGKFYNTQLHRIRINIPAQIFYAKIAGWKKFMAVVMLAFGSILFGCDVTTDDLADKKNMKTEKPNQDYDLVGILSMPIVPSTDSIQLNFETTKGEPAMIGTPSITTIGFTQSVITGDIEVKPDTIKEEHYETVGVIMLPYDTSIIKQIKKDSLPKSKIAADTSNCKGEHFY